MHKSEVEVDDQRGFVSVQYAADEHGEMRPVARPDRCAASEVGERCKVVMKCRRSRKTGPGYSVDVLICSEHGSFTVYPPGHVPHGREAAVPVNAAGHPVSEEAVDIPKQRSTFRSGGGSCGGRVLGR